MHPNTFDGTWNNDILGHSASIGLFPSSVLEGILVIKYVAVKTPSDQNTLGHSSQIREPG